MNSNIDFCVVGPQRTSTTWIYERLLESGKINLPIKVKETFFFDKKYNKGLTYYFSLFGNLDARLLTGEVGPTYFHSRIAAERIYKTNNKCKIIYIYRDPVEKSISLYKHHYRKGRVNKDFWKAILKRPDIIESSRYSKYSKIWSELFTNDNLLMICFDDLIHDPQKFLDNITKFIGMEKIIVDGKNNEKTNRSSTPRYWIIAKIFGCLAFLMRKYDFHAVVEVGKRLGFKKVFEGGKVKRDFSQEEEWLRKQFKKKDFKEV